MTDQPEMLPLPGVEVDSRKRSALEDAARRTLRALWAEGVLDDKHALLCQLILELAKAVDAGARAGRASAVAMAAAQLREAYDALPIPAVGSGVRDAWEELADDLRAAAVRHTS